MCFLSFSPSLVKLYTLWIPRQEPYLLEISPTSTSLSKTWLRVYWNLCTSFSFSNSTTNSRSSNTFSFPFRSHSNTKILCRQAGKVNYLHSWCQGRSCSKYHKIQHAPFSTQTGKTMCVWRNPAITYRSTVSLIRAVSLSATNAFNPGCFRK